MAIVSAAIRFLLLPSNFIAFIAALGLVSLLLRRLRLGRAFLAIAAVALIIAGWSPLGPVALDVLEDRFPAPQLTEPVTGIILLGGAVNTHITATRGQAAMNDSGERITAIAALARRFPAARLLLSGGANHILTSESVTESAVARDLLVELGVDAARIEMEEISRDTCENAEQSLLAAKPRADERWLLVTSASHMSRAVGCFRKVGFAVVPYPVDYRTRGPAGDRWSITSVADGLEAIDLAAHEWIGLLGYRMAGRIADLFPSP